MKLTREQRSAFFRDEFPRITFPGAKPCPVEPGATYWLSSLSRLVVTKVRRSRKGEWVVIYVVERREAPYYLADKSPKASTEQQRAKFPEWQARGYTRSRSQSLDQHADAVYFADDNDPILMDARKRFAEHRHENAKEQQAEENVRQVTKQLRDLAVAIHRSGGEPIEFLANIQRQIAAKQDELRDAA